MSPGFLTGRSGETPAAKTVPAVVPVDGMPATESGYCSNRLFSRLRAEGRGHYLNYPCQLDTDEPPPKAVRTSLRRMHHPARFMATELTLKSESALQSSLTFLPLVHAASERSMRKLEALCLAHCWLTVFLFWFCGKFGVFFSCYDKWCLLFLIFLSALFYTRFEAEVLGCSHFYDFLPFSHLCIQGWNGCYRFRGHLGPFFLIPRQSSIPSVLSPFFFLNSIFVSPAYGRRWGGKGKRSS